LALPAGAAAQNCSPSHTETAFAIYAQVLELGGGRRQDFWAGKLAEGVTVKQTVSVLAKEPTYAVRFINGRDDRTVLHYLFQHLLAREPTDADLGWLIVAQSSGWNAVVDGLMNSSEYNTRFGDHVVPGSPVVAWDCARATGVFEAHHNAVRDVTQGSVNLSYTTPSYVSLDQARSVTLLYSKEMVSPRGLVQVNVIDNTGTPPNRASIRLQVEGAWVTDEIFFTAGAGATRLAASFAAHGYPSGALPVTAVVRKYYPDNTSQEHTISTRAIIVNERASQIGTGWVVAGVQKLRDQADGVFISESGTGAWFSKAGTDANGTRRYASPAGDFTRVRWDASENVYLREYPDGSRVTFNPGGQMTSAKNRFGDSTTYSYGPAGHFAGMKDPLGKETIFYYGCCAVTAIQDPSGRRVYTETYGEVLYRFRDPADNSLALDAHFVRDATNGWVPDTYWTPGGDRTVGAHTGWSVAYDWHGKLAYVSAPQVATTDAGTTRPVTQFRSLETAVLAPAGAGTSANHAPRVQPHEVRVQVTDPRGNIARMAVDPFGAPTRVEDPLGGATNITRDRHGRAVRTETATGHWVRYGYAGVELHEILDADGKTTYAEYEPLFHQPTHIWGNATTGVWNTYDMADPQRKLLTTRSGTAAAPATSFAYTTRGRVKSVTDPEGHGTFHQYGDEAGANPWGNLHETSVGTATGTYRRTTTLRYDAYGRRVRVLLPGNDSTITGYDLNNRVTHSVGPAQDTTRYEHRPAGLYRVTDARGQSYVFNRNALGWVESEIDPRNRYTYYGYNRAGGATSMTNRRGQTITSTYDVLGRMETRNADGQQTTWSYDPAYRWMQASNAESTNRIEYDASGRPTRMVTTLGGVSYTQDVAYDSTGRRRRMDVYGPWTGSRAIEYGYNARGQLDTLRNFAGAATVFAYNDDGQEETRTLPSGMVLGRGYISTHAPAEIWFGSHAIQDRHGAQYRYGASGLVDARLTTYQDPSASGVLVRHYEYDSRGWLKGVGDEKVPPESSVTYCNGTQDIDPDTGVACTEPPAPESEWVNRASWAYDAVGNRSAIGGVVETGNRVTASDGLQMSYDDDGNLLRKLNPGGYDDLGLAWNSLSQLIGVSRHAQGNVAYGYDAFGRRVRRTAPDGSVVRYLYDGDDLLMELGGAGNPIREYTHLPGVDRPHSVRVSATGTTYYYATDHPGNVIGLVDGANQLVNEYRYNPWGEPELVTEGVPQPLRFTAREWDATAGLYQVRARWYDPQTGRFVSEDPIGLAGGINPYVYAANNPVIFTDPSGLAAMVVGIHMSYDDLLTLLQGYAGTLADMFFRAWGFFEPTDTNAYPGSSCDLAGCRLRSPSSDEWARVMRTIVQIRTDIEFCARVKAAGFAMAGRQLLMWDNFTRNPHGPGQMYGNAPDDAAQGGVVMYLYSKTWSDGFHHQATVHEAVHGVVRRGDANGLPLYFADGATTPLGTIDQAATTCRGG
jgi:RHS repeat-associated protein